MQPFGNTLVVKTCTGQQLYDVLHASPRGRGSSSWYVGKGMVDVEQVFDELRLRVRVALDGFQRARDVGIGERAAGGAAARRSCDADAVAVVPPGGAS